MSTTCAVKVHPNIRYLEARQIHAHWRERDLLHSRDVRLAARLFRSERRLVQAQIWTMEHLAEMPHRNFHMVSIYRVRCFNPHHMGVGGGSFPTCGFPTPESEVFERTMPTHILRRSGQCDVFHQCLLQRLLAVINRLSADHSSFAVLGQSCATTFINCNPHC